MTVERIAGKILIWLIVFTLFCLVRMGYRKMRGKKSLLTANSCLVFLAAVLIPCCLYVLHMSSSQQSAGTTTERGRKGPSAPKTLHLTRERIESGATKRLPTGVRRATTVITVSGQGENADWGIAKSASFVLTYTFVCETEILEKRETALGSLKVVERRKFITADEVLQVSEADVRFAIKECVKPSNLTLAFGAAEVIGSFFGMNGTGAAAAEAVDLVDGKSARKLLGGISPGGEKLLDDMAQQFIDMRVKNLFKTSDVKGKTYRVSYVQDANGPSMVDFAHEDGRTDLTEDERMVLRRANAFVDSQFMPNEHCVPGDTWTVNSGDFSCLLDPYVSGSYDGKLTAERLENQADGKWTVKVHPGAVSIKGDDGNSDGHAEIKDGIALLDKSSRELRQMQLVGKCAMQRTENGWFFNARLNGACDFVAQMKTEKQ